MKFLLCNKKKKKNKIHIIDINKKKFIFLEYYKKLILLTFNYFNSKEIGIVKSELL